MSKKFVCMLVAFLMVLSVIPMSAFAGGVPVKGDQIAFWNFDENSLEEDGWTVVDADGDGKNWERVWYDNYHSTPYSLRSGSYIGGILTPDNWAITPAVEIPEDGAYLTYYVENYSSSFPETYRVYVGTSNGIDSMEPVTEDITPSSAEYEMQTIDLADYAGETVYIAFRNYNCRDKFKIYLDDVAVMAGSPADEPAEPSESPVAPSESPVEYIDTIEINDFVVPVWGEEPFYDVTVPEDAHYSLYNTSWRKGYPYYEAMGDGEVFDDSDVAYYQSFTIEPDEGYEFADDLTVLINGGEEYFNYVSRSSYFNSCYVYTVNFYVEEPVEPTDAPVEYIDTIEINDFVEPAWNEEPFYDVTVPEDAHYSIDYTDWKYRADEGFDSLMGEGDVFDNSECAYFQYFEIVPDEGYKFADEVTVLINGSESNVDYDSSLLDEDVYYVYSVEFFVESVIQTEEPVVPTEEPVIPTEEPVVPTEEPVDYIDTIEINGFVVPEWGAAPFYDVTVPEDAHYSIVYTDWNWWDWDNEEIMQEGDVFDNANVAYYQYFELVPDDGYAFVDELTILINGSEEYADTLFSGFNEEDNKFHIFTVDFFVEEPEFVTHWGDANGDGVVDSTDVLLLMRYVMGVDEIEEENLEWCDVNGDGSIDMSDALFVSRYVMGSIDVFPIEENE